MDTVPNIISTKDLAYLTDMFHWNFVAAKEIYHFMNEVKEEGIKEILEDAFRMHTVHCKFILTILQGGEDEE